MTLSAAAHAWYLGGWPDRIPQAMSTRAISARMIEPPIPVMTIPVVAMKVVTKRRASPTTAPLVEATAAPDAEGVHIAPPREWTYHLRQGDRQGIARLSWQPQDDGYHLLLTRELDGKPLPGWRSEGGLDAKQGLVPRRYATQRQGRDSQATNFRREEGLISFSASREQFALVSGVQDRLSWWLQLAARVAGAPQRFGAGGEIRITVAGLRGEPIEWIFDILGEEALVLPQQQVPAALHLRRAALGPYDGAIDVWLDPARDHLPVKLAVSTVDENGWAMELLDDTPPNTPPR
ncbi:DUF3108 domain-containing protein [Roseateles agri]|uniref:DUF3108 domain-containing protein n=1 Tax=Roseateles agri TaxID=3098619 RepID=UPI002A5A5D30|nr:DUF3108 domain-containing protein [Paucibacter sp. R3-3]